MKNLQEATRPYVAKLTDPALLTFSEWANIANPGDKFHPSSAYDIDIEKLNDGFDQEAKASYSNLINTFSAKGIEFEVREKVTDKWKGRYVKSDTNGMPIRGENNQVLFYDAEEIKDLIPEDKRFEYEYLILRKDTQEVVGATQDEWGTLLIRVAQEYRGFGFGTLLGKLSRTKNPARQSGGFTSAGFENFRRVHAEMVRDYLSSGLYSHLVKSGVITKERVREIVDSVKTARKTPPKDQSLKTDDPKDWLIFSDSSYAVLYDKKIFNIDINENPYWFKQFIKGFVALNSTDTKVWVESKLGATATLIEVLLNDPVGEKIYVNRNDFVALKQKLGNALQSEETQADATEMVIKAKKISPFQIYITIETNTGKGIVRGQEYKNNELVGAFGQAIASKITDAMREDGSINFTISPDQAGGDLARTVRSYQGRNPTLLGGMVQVWVNKPTLNIASIRRTEKKTREQFDKFGEIIYTIIETAENISG